MDKKNHARMLYLTTAMSQKEIAIEVGVSERTIHTWIHQYAWNKLRTAAQQAPATIIENFNSQIVEMQNAVAAREVGKRFPDAKEADVFRKLVNAAGAMKKTVSLSQSMQMMECFREFVRPLNKQFAQQLAHYADRFFSAKAVNGYLPYQMEYGIDTAVALSPFYNELKGTEPCDTENSPAYPTNCTDLSTCTSEQCNWPKCRSQEPITDDVPATEIDIPWAPIEPGSSTDIPSPEIPQFIPENTHNALINIEIVPDEALAVFNPQPAETGSNPAILEHTENQQITPVIDHTEEVQPGTENSESPSLPEQPFSDPVQSFSADVYNPTPANDSPDPDQPYKLSPELEAYWLELKKQIAPQEYGLSDAALKKIFDKLYPDDEEEG